MQKSVMQSLVVDFVNNKKRNGVQKFLTLMLEVATLKEIARIVRNRLLCVTSRVIQKKLEQ